MPNPYRMMLSVLFVTVICLQALHDFNFAQPAPGITEAASGINYLLFPLWIAGLISVWKRGVWSNPFLLFSNFGIGVHGLVLLLGGERWGAAFLAIAVVNLPLLFYARTEGLEASREDVWESPERMAS